MPNCPAHVLLLSTIQYGSLALACFDFHELNFMTHAHTHTHSRLELVYFASLGFLQNVQVGIGCWCLLEVDIAWLSSTMCYIEVCASFHPTSLCNLFWYTLAVQWVGWLFFLLNRCSSIYIPYMCACWKNRWHWIHDEMTLNNKCCVKSDNTLNGM